MVERLRDFSTSTDDRVFVAEDGGGRVLGVASAHRLPLFHVSGYLIRITALAVCKAAQGTGVGRMLVQAVEAWAWGAGAIRIEVTSGDHRPAAHAFYQAVGYAVDERRFVKGSPVRGGEGR
ncbi:GNAT family N-acetyltransferase [Dyella thiooxydans]|uniref:GNAT family N-acetyltransferase n=1 Tax=Dyella thiooxydans TaxID=445710 RepID=UPI001969EAE6|nr:GNAT family N-acetyltransferase [Dyella thiooxydans]